MPISLYPCNVAPKNVITPHNNNTALFKHLVLITQEHREKLWCGYIYAIPMFGDDLCFLLNHTAGGKNSTAYYYPNLL